MAYDWLTATDQPSVYGGGYGAANGGYALPQQQQNPLSGISGLLKSGAAANYNFKGTNTKPLQDILSQIMGLTNAQINPDNPIYQHLYQEEQGSAQQDLASSIAEMGRQNRKLSSLGRTPLFDPERGGEQIFRQLTQGYQTAQDTARQRARQILGAGQQGLNTAFTQQSAITGLQDQNQKKQAYGYGNIADILPLLGKFLK